MVMGALSAFFGHRSFKLNGNSIFEILKSRGQCFDFLRQVAFYWPDKVNLAAEGRVSLQIQDLRKLPNPEVLSGRRLSNEIQKRVFNARSLRITEILITLIDLRGMRASPKCLGTHEKRLHNQPNYAFLVGRAAYSSVVTEEGLPRISQESIQIAVSIIFPHYVDLALIDITPHSVSLHTGRSIKPRFRFIGRKLPSSVLNILEHCATNQRNPQTNLPRIYDYEAQLHLPGNMSFAADHLRLKKATSESRGILGATTPGM
ncbi:uncharacterized protein ARMOST_10681 [Armillaria ostoyae]|uniref:Uncharacterized protein n=1 Tax=Armillaria ostoyae TaxID=47428 RepID=A0A284RF18_ARMOS|nr:uncharacterized protein ARMOST_10681 [Armillaria ostoyae]